jgi:excisionase family DNA binding protein
MSDRLDAAIRELIEALAESVRTEAATGPSAPDRLYSVDEAASILNLGRSRIYLEIGAGRLRTVQVGRRRLVPASSVRDFVAERIA